MHISHYGRICPIETPEGTNIGLISSLGDLRRRRRVRLPRHAVPRGQARQASPTRSSGCGPTRRARPTSPRPTRRPTTRASSKGPASSPAYQTDFAHRPRRAGPVHRHLARSRWSASRPALIPFLEHDDANRALMGSNMQRQAVPLLIAEPPIVATGLEKAVAQNSRHGRQGRSRTAPSPTSTRRGSSSTTTDELQAAQVRRPQRADLPEPEADRRAGPEGQEGRDPRRRRRHATRASWPWAATSWSRFMTWDGYNFEDAIIISERLVKEDVFTSIHIEEFEIEIRETKLGREEFTRDIPNVSREGAAEPRRERHRPRSAPASSRATSSSARSRRSPRAS